MLFSFSVECSTWRSSVSDWQESSTEHKQAYQLACSDILDCKLRIFESQSSGGCSLDPKLLQKMTYYCKQGIEANKQIIANGRDGSKEIIEAELAMAKFYNQFFSPDKGRLIYQLG